MDSIIIINNIAAVQISSLVFGPTATTDETLKLTFRQNYWPTFSPTVPLFAARISRIIWTWRHLALEVGTSKPWGGSGSHNKPIACGASGAYASGTVEEEEEVL